MGEEVKTVTRRDILEGAATNVCRDREGDYGAPENSFNAIATFWRGYIWEKYGTFVPLDGTDIGLMMALFKISRIAKGRFKADSFIDGCGYMACAGEIAANAEKSESGGNGEMAGTDSSAYGLRMTGAGRQPGGGRGTTRGSFPTGCRTEARRVGAGTAKTVTCGVRGNGMERGQRKARARWGKCWIWAMTR